MPRGTLEEPAIYGTNTARTEALTMRVAMQPPMQKKKKDTLPYKHQLPHNLKKKHGKKVLFRSGFLAPK